MSETALIQYRDFYDVPRIFLVDHRGTLYLFDCKFDDQIDEYPDTYKVFVLPSDLSIDLGGSWDPLSTNAIAYLGEVDVKSVKFDPTLRKGINTDVIEEIHRKAKQD